VFDVNQKFAVKPVNVQLLAKRYCCNCRNVDSETFFLAHGKFTRTHSTPYI